MKDRDKEKKKDYDEHKMTGFFGTIISPRLIVEEGALREAKCQTGETTVSQPAALPAKEGTGF
jgi:hypothetical protein